MMFDVKTLEEQLNMYESSIVLEALYQWAAAHLKRNRPLFPNYDVETDIISAIYVILSLYYGDEDGDEADLWIGGAS